MSAPRSAVERYRARPTPIEAAKLVARERYAWPGGYPLVLVMSDGETLCPDCVARNFREIARATRDGDRSGWAAEGYQVEEAPEADVSCAHCRRVICEGVGA